MPIIYRKSIINLVTGEKQKLDPVELSNEQYENYLNLYIEISAKDFVNKMKAQKKGA